MKKILIIALSAMLYNTSFAQNLVPNWSFEDTVSCPTAITQINRALGWSSYSQTPDYFNVCNGGQVGVPLNAFGFQNALSGNAYAGFAAFHVGNLREYIGSQLIQPLDSGFKYFASLYVSRATYNTQNKASNKIGIKFSTVSYSQGNPQPTDNYAQIFSDSIIEDTLNWVKISGSFIADSAYQYVSIGNFFTDSLTSVISYDTLNGVAYYFLECVCVSVDSLACNSNVGIPENNLPLKLIIFPNPVANSIYIINKTNEIVEAEIYDSMGQLISKYTLKKMQNEISMSTCTRGIYILIFKQKNNIFQKKIIKY